MYRHNAHLLAACNRPIPTAAAALDATIATAACTPTLTTTAAIAIPHLRSLSHTAV